MTRDPLGVDVAGNPVTLAELWPAEDEIRMLIAKNVNGEAFRRNDILKSTGSREWMEMEGGDGLVYQWGSASDYLKEPPFATLPGCGLGRRHP